MTKSNLSNIYLKAPEIQKEIEEKFQSKEVNYTSEKYKE